MSPSSPVRDPHVEQQTLLIVGDIVKLHKLVGPLLLQITDSYPDIALDAADGSLRWEEIGFAETTMHTRKSCALLSFVAGIVYPI
jgi:hypothetical protein